MSNYTDLPQPQTKHLEDCQDFFRQSATNFEMSHNEAELVQSLYDDNHYNMEQIQELKESGRPIETYNVIKKYTRNLTGYLSTVVTDINIKPTSYRHVKQAKLRDSTVQFILKENQWAVLQDDINEMTALAGLTTIKYTVKDTEKTDVVGRKILDIKLALIPSRRVLPDPLDNTYDYSNARYTHEWMWMPESEVKRLFGNRKTKKLKADAESTLNMPLANMEYNFLDIKDGMFKRHKHYLIVRTILRKGNTESYTDTYWCGNHQLSKTNISYNPYRCFRLHKGKLKPEFYGVFREVIETQKAINQAVLQIQLLVNSDKVFVDENAVDDLAKFTREYNRVNAVIGMLDLEGYRVENLSQDVVAQYHILDAAIQRIQGLLGINDSFLGLANASDSGRKVQLQQNSSVVALRYFTKHIEHIYNTIGKDLAVLSQRYMTAHRIMRSSDDIGGDNWAEINRPFQMPMDDLDTEGNIQYQFVANPEVVNNGFVLDASGAVQHTVVNEPDTDTSVDLDMDIEVKTSAYGESEEVEKVILEAMMNGNPGMMLQQINPARYAKLIEIYAMTLKSEHSPALVELFRGIQQDLGGLEDRDPRDTEVGQGQGQQQGNISANSGALTHAMGITNNNASAGYNAKKG